MNIMHGLHGNTNAIPYVQNDGINTNMPIPVVWVASLDVVHPSYLFVISIIEEELVVH